MHITMNTPLLAAALISAATIALHVFGGGPEFHSPAQASDMSAAQKAVYSVLWHAVTLILVINSTALVLALKPAYRKLLVAIVSAQYLAFAALFILYGTTRLGSLWPLPQWIIFFTIAVLALWSLRQKRPL